MSIEPLTWEATYALAERLQAEHPEVDLEQVSLGQIYRWIAAWADFEDDLALANDDILLAVYREWLEMTLDDQG